MKKKGFVICSCMYVLSFNYAAVTAIYSNSSRLLNYTTLFSYPTVGLKY